MQVHEYNCCILNQMEKKYDRNEKKNIWMNKLREQATKDVATKALMHASRHRSVHGQLYFITLRIISEIF